MNRRSYLICILLLTAYWGAMAQPKKFSKLVGTWTLVAVDNILADGKRVQLYGPEPQGRLMFDAEGRYSLQIFRAVRPKFAANDKSKGSPEEYQAAVQGSNAHFGRYSVEGTDSITFHIEHASYPNWEGTEQKRSFKIVGDRLTYIVSTPTTGGTAATGEVVWQRVK